MHNLLIPLLLFHSVLSFALGYVEAVGNAKANGQAREIADRDASSFDCKRDRAKHYGAGGNLVNESQ